MKYITPQFNYYHLYLFIYYTSRTLDTFADLMPKAFSMRQPLGDVEKIGNKFK